MKVHMARTCSAIEAQGGGGHGTFDRSRSDSHCRRGKARRQIAIDWIMRESGRSPRRPHATRAVPEKCRRRCRAGHRDRFLSWLACRHDARLHRGFLGAVEIEVCAGRISMRRRLTFDGDTTPPHHGGGADGRALPPRPR